MKRMAHKEQPLVHWPDGHDLYSDDLDLSWPELVKIAAGVFFLLVLFATVAFAVSLSGPA